MTIFKHAFVVDLIISLSLAVVLSFFIPIARPFGDALIYHNMAFDPTEFSIGHWGFRILTPWIVHVLPFSVPDGYTLVTTVAIAGTGVAFAALCRAAKLKRRSQILSEVIFLLSLPSTYALYDRQLVDPITYLGTVLMFLFLERRRFILAGVCILLTTLNKEWGIFLIAPFIIQLFIDRIVRLRAPTLAECIVAINLPLAAFFLVRYWPHFGTGQYQDSIFRLVEDFKIGSVGNPFLAASGALGALLWIAPFGWSRASTAIRLTVVLLPFVLLQWIDSGSSVADVWPWDELRMMAYAFPVAILFTVIALDELSFTSWGIAAFVCLISMMTPIFPEFVAIQNSDSPFGARWIQGFYEYHRHMGGPDLSKWTHGNLHFFLSIWAELIVMVLIFISARSAKSRGKNAIAQGST